MEKTPQPWRGLKKYFFKVKMPTPLRLVRRQSPEALPRRSVSPVEEPQRWPQALAVHAATSLPPLGSSHWILTAPTEARLDGCSS